MTVDAHQHFKNKHAQRIPVHTLVVSLALHNLGRNCRILHQPCPAHLAQRNARLTVIRRAAQRPRDIRHELGKPKVGHLDVSVRAEQQVFGLEVAVDDVERVQVVERERDLGRVEFGDRVGEALAGGGVASVAADVQGEPGDRVPDSFATS